MEIVLNKCYGAFGLSKAAYKYMGLEWHDCTKIGVAYINDRTNENLIKCVKALGNEANVFCSDLRVVSIPDEEINSYKIVDDDGWETLYYSKSKIYVA